VNFYRITAELKAPIIIQQDRQSYAPSGLNYLPGSSLRGALAAKFLRQGGSPEASGFRALFLDQPVRFPNLLPTDDPAIIPRVLPLTTISCKRHPGFQAQGKHGVRDTLALTAGNRILGKRGVTQLYQCPYCNEDMKPFSGFWNADLANPHIYDSTMLYQRHTGIDRATGTVAPSIFFTTQAIGNFRKNPENEEYVPQYLSGGLFLNQRQHEILRSLLGNGVVFAGADRTRGFGELEISLVEAQPQVFNLREWDKAFQDRFRQAIGQELPAGRYFSLKLESPTILLDQFLRPTSEITLSFTGITPVLKVAKEQIIRGWQTSWGLPKPDDRALAAGSIFLFRYQGEDLDGLISFLQQLEINGLGPRKAEGLGRVSICEPIHLQVQEVI